MDGERTKVEDQGLEINFSGGEAERRPPDQVVAPSDESGKILVYTFLLSFHGDRVKLHATLTGCKPPPFDLSRQ